LNSNIEQSEYWARNVRRRRPDASIAHFFEAFPFADARVRREIAGALAAQGFPETSA
jgi:hypothetical protein